MPVMDRYDSVKMLTSSASQYLPPDYFQPILTTVDAKNSPLALLAQTCSSIGKDPPPKSIIPAFDKKEISSKSPNVDNGGSRGIKSSPVRDNKDGRHSMDNHRQKSDDNDKREIRNFYPISTSSPKLEKVQTEKQRFKEDKKKNDGDTKSQTASHRPLSSSSNGLEKLNTDTSSPRPKTNDYTKDNCDSKYSPPLKSPRSESPTRRDNSPIQDNKHLHSMYSGLPFVPIGYTNMPYGSGAFTSSAEALAAAGYAYGLPRQSSYNLASAHALAVHQAALKSNSSAALAQYMQYARMRNPTGLPGCKDPYCTNCVSASLSQNVHLPSQCTSPCCAQCSHEKSLQEFGLFGFGATNPLHSPFSGPPSTTMGFSHLHSLYAHNLLTQQEQHVCNWMMGNDYCGKRFNSPEELLQHLRTHTSGGESVLSAYGALGLSIPPTDVTGIPGYLNFGSISPGTVRRMYPSSVSPLSSRTMSSRYHPYKSALPNLPSGISQQALSSLGPYYSPYTLFGQRIGSAAVP